LDDEKQPAVEAVADVKPADEQRPVAEPGNEKPSQPVAVNGNKAEPVKEWQREFNEEPMRDQLSRLEGKFGRDRLADFFKLRYGTPDYQALRADMDTLKIDTARANLALKHGLTPTQAAAIPGNTPEEVAANLDAMLAFAEERKPAEVEAPASPFSIPQKIEDKPELSVKDAEAAIRRAGGGYTRN